MLNRPISARRIRTQAEWKVETHISLARLPTRSMHPAAHLGRRLVGEGDGQDRARVHPALADQIADPPGQHPGLARTGAGHHQHRPALVQHRLPLRRVQSLQQLFGGQSGGPGLRRTRHSRSSLRRQRASLPRRFVISQPTLDVSTDTYDQLAAHHSAWRQRKLVACGCHDLARHAAQAHRAGRGRSAGCHPARAGVVDYRRKKLRKPATFPRLPPGSVTVGARRSPSTPTARTSIATC